MFLVFALVHMRSSFYSPRISRKMLLVAEIESLQTRNRDLVAIQDEMQMQMRMNMMDKCADDDAGTGESRGY